MSHRRRISLAALLISAAVVTSARSQNNTPEPSATVPVQTNQASPPVAPQPAAKKVWTNDDLTRLQGNSVISTVGPTSSAAKPADKSAAAKNRDAKSYQDQIAKLQAQIPPIDSQIAELQAAIDGKPTGDAKESARPRSVKIDDWSVEMQQFQKKRDDIDARIATLRDEARHHGVADNVLP